MNKSIDNVFGEQLRHYRHQSIDPQTGKRLTQDRLGELLEEIAAVPGLDGKRIGRWERGIDVIDHDERRDLLVGWLQVLHHCGGLNSLAKANELLKLGKYSALTSAEALQINPNWKAAAMQTLPAVAFTIQDVTEVLKSYRLPHIESHLRTPAGVVIWSLNQLQDLPYLKMSMILAVVVATHQMLRPSFAWPLTDQAARLPAYALFVLANLIIPPLVAYLTRPDYENQLRMETRPQRWMLFHLQWIGAQVGFVAFSLAALLVSLALYHLDISCHIPRILDGLTMLPLFMSYVSASRIPIDRQQMFKDEPKLHDADLFFWRFFIIAPAVLMPFFYFGHDLFANPQFGGSLAVVLFAFILWHRRDKEVPQLADIPLLCIVGILTPLLIFYFNRQLFLTPYPQNMEEWLMVITIMSYFVAAVTLWAAVWLWHVPHLTLSGFSLFVGYLALIMIVSWAGYRLIVILCLIIVVGWPFFYQHERGREMRYYSGVVGFFVAVSLSMVGLIQGQIPVGLNLALFWLFVSVWFMGIYWSGHKTVH